VGAVVLRKECNNGGAGQGRRKGEELVKRQRTRNQRLVGGKHPGQGEKRKRVTTGGKQEKGGVGGR